MLRGILNSLFFVALTLIGSLAALASWPFDRSGDTILRLARLWSRLVLAVAGVRLDVEQRVLLDRGRPYLFMANHLSTVDIWALFLAIPVPVRMIAKKQLGRIPLFGWAMRAGKFIFIDRQNPVRARASIAEAARRIASGNSVLIFPEGTRSRDGKLAPFRKGGFHLAIDAGVPIVPVAIRGSREVMPRRSPLLRPGRVVVRLGEPIPTIGVAHETKEALLERVRTAIVSMLEEDSVASDVPASSPAQ